MPISEEIDDGVVTRNIAAKSDQASARITMVPGDGYDAPNMTLKLQGERGDTVRNLKDSLGIGGNMEPNTASPRRSGYEVPNADRALVLDRLGLPRDLGGEKGVTIRFGMDSADHGSTSVSIIANDPKAPPFTPEHATNLLRQLAQHQAALPDAMRTEVLRANPNLVAGVRLESQIYGGTAIHFNPVERGNLPFAIRHDAATGMDQLVLPATSNRAEMQELNTRVTEHLKAHGIVPVATNMERVSQVLDLHEGRANLEVHARTGGLQITLPQGSGEKALAALSQPAQFRVDNAQRHSAPILMPEIATAATPEMAAVVRPVAVEEHRVVQEHGPARSGAAHMGGATRAQFGNILTKLGLGAGAAVISGVAAGAQAHEGERVAVGLQEAGKALAENALPGVTKTDLCEKVGAYAAVGGGMVGGAIGAGGSMLGTAATAAPTLGASLVASPWTTAAGMVLGTVNKL